jgi:hypothetical protein
MVSFLCGLSIKQESSLRELFTQSQLPNQILSRSCCLHIHFLFQSKTVFLSLSLSLSLSSSSFQITTPEQLWLWLKTAANSHELGQTNKPSIQLLIFRKQITTQLGQNLANKLLKKPCLDHIKKHCLQVPISQTFGNTFL